MSTSLSGSSSNQRRKELNRPDEFQKTVRGGFKKVESYQRPLGYALLGLLLLSLGWIFYTSQKQAKEAAASDTLFLAVQVLNSELSELAKTYPLIPKPVAETENPLENLESKKTPTKKPELVPQSAQDIQHQPFDVSVKLPKTLAELQKVMDLHPGTRAAHEAQLQVGKLYFDHGDAKTALSWFEKAVKSSPNKFYQSSAELLHALSLEAVQDCKSALTSFDRVISIKENSLLGEGLMGKARCLETLNDFPEAKKVYDKVITDMPDTSYSRTAEALRSRI